MLYCDVLCSIVFYFVSQTALHIVFCTGTFDGNGAKWWGWLKYLEIQENRPRLLHLVNATELFVEHILLKVRCGKKQLVNNRHLANSEVDSKHAYHT